MRHAESSKRPLDHRRIQPARDEYQTRASILVGPPVQVPRRMHQMLKGMLGAGSSLISERAIPPQQRG
jgi:hypothetical protein